MIFGYDVVGTQTFATGIGSVPVQPNVWVVSCPAISSYQEQAQQASAWNDEAKATSSYQNEAKATSNWNDEAKATSEWGDIPRDETTTDECNQ